MRTTSTVGASVKVTLVVLATALLAANPALPAFASESHHFAISASDSATVIREFAAQSGVQILVAAKTVGGKRLNAVRGEHSMDEALTLMLEGTGLVHRYMGERAVALVADASTSAAPVRAGEDQGAAREARSDTATIGTAAATESVQLEEIVVTGTNIKGASPAGSPVIVIDEKAIQRSGYSTTEQLIQSLPQNVRGSSEGATADGLLGTGALRGLNSTRGSGADLRGLGSKSTLTLINGHRIAPSAGGTFTDLSLIPITAIERIEVLADGASAIYGADAVGGVLNIILKKDFDGSESRARYGVTTDSGREELRLSHTLGSSWGRGSALAVFDYLKQSELLTSERDFTSNLPSPTTILPENKQLGFVLSAQQQLSERWSAQLDAQYQHAERLAHRFNPAGAGSLQLSPIDINRGNAGASIAYQPFGDWEISFNGTVSREDIDFGSNFFDARTGAPIAASSSQQTQEQYAWSGGITANGSLWTLPAGRLGLALGAEYRYEDYLREVPLTATREPADRNVRAAFAELHIPLFGKFNRRTGLDRLELSIAGRYDEYSDFGSTTNPKFGVSWSPIQSLELRGSYSTSFRPPATGRELSDSIAGTAAQVPIYALLSPNNPTQFAPVVGLVGAAPLVAEDAENWSAGFTFRPQFVEGLEVSFNWYDIHYKNRIVNAAFALNVLSDPALRGFVKSFATPADLQAFVAQQYPSGVTPAYSDFTFLTLPPPGNQFGPMPQNVATYLFDFRATNAAVVDTNGFDVLVNYAIPMATGRLNIGFNANHIDKIATIFSPGAPAFDYIDTVGNPASWRFRTTGAYSAGRFDAALAVNYTGSYEDTGATQARDVGATVTVDGNLRYSLPDDDSALGNLVFTLSVVNLFNRAPPYVSASAAGTHYDPANADPLGRMISVEVGKRW